MKRQAFIAVFLLSLLLGAGRNFAASIPVTLDLTNIQLQGRIQLAATPLPVQAFAGKNVVIPLTIQSDAVIQDLKQVNAEIVYQLVDSAGTVQGNWTRVPVQLQKDPRSPLRLLGTAIIERAQFQSISTDGKLRYYFRAQKGGQQVLLSPSLAGVDPGPGVTAPPDSFEVAFIDTLQFPVSRQGGRFVAPDTHQVDGKTAVTLDGGALSGPGTLTIRREDGARVPAGPRGLKPVTAYSFTLDGGASLVRTARITLSYPANVDGTVGEDRLNWRDLALYRYAEAGGWQIVSRPDTDPTLHTLTGVTPRFSLFALFATGPTSGADLRPRERILTPNGDNLNDSAEFHGLDFSETVNIFDVRGRRVRTIHGPPHIWDGRDEDGQIVESGVYLYQYTTQGERVSGVIVIAK